MPLFRGITISLSIQQAEALLSAAEIGDKRIREAGLPGGHKARNGALRILERTIANLKAVEKEKASPAAPGAP